MWFKVDDKFHDHPKVQRLLEEGKGDALSLWVLSGSWSGDQLSDGLVSVFVLSRWGPDYPAYAEHLVEVGLWSREEHEGRMHYRFHDWTDYNDDRETVLSDRAAKAMRAALHRDPALISAIKRRDKDRCRYCGTQVNWRASRGKAAATYDHVKPIDLGGTNVLDNVVVACKGCNDRKNKRLPRDAGMRVLAPGSLGAPVLDESAPGSGPYSVRTQPGSESRSGTPEVDAPGRVGSGRVGSGPQSVLSTDSDHQHEHQLQEADR